MDFGTFLTIARQSRGLSMPQLAKQTGISTQALWYLERGVNRHPKLDTLWKLHDALKFRWSALATLERGEESDATT